MATLVSRVIAIDNNRSDISFLRAQLPQKTNIIVSEKDFTKDVLSQDFVDGVLFGFSLHYQPNSIPALRNAFNHLKPNGSIIIFEYTRDKPLPWVPFPIPEIKLTESLKKIGFREIETIIQKRRFYVIHGKKVMKK